MTMKRVYNFAPGPSTMPQEVLEQAAREMLCYGDTGMNVMEMSHRSKQYQAIFDETEATLRDLMHISQEYAVLFLQGGASGVFASLPMNLGTKNGKADYIVSGNFSGQALKEAKKYINAREAGSSKADDFNHIPTQAELDLDPEADYVHVCWNNTIFGTKWNYIPDTGNVPLVAEMSSRTMSLTGVARRTPSSGTLSGFQK